MRADCTRGSNRENQDIINATGSGNRLFLGLGGCRVFVALKASLVSISAVLSPVPPSPENYRLVWKNALHGPQARAHGRAVPSRGSPWVPEVVVILEVRHAPTCTGPGTVLGAPWFTRVSPTPAANAEPLTDGGGAHGAPSRARARWPAALLRLSHVTASRAPTSHLVGSLSTTCEETSGLFYACFLRF